MPVPLDSRADVESSQRELLANIRPPAKPLHHHLRRWGFVALTALLAAYAVIVYALVDPTAALAMGPSGLMALLLMYFNLSERARDRTRK